MERYINKVHHRDCLDLMQEMPKSQIDLIYIDPPFCCEADKKFGMIAWNKNTQPKNRVDEILPLIEEIQGVGMANYLRWLYSRLYLMRELLNEKGSIFVHVDYHVGHYVKILLDEIFGKSNFVNEIIWCYKDVGGGRNNDFYKRKHDSIFWYSKGQDYKLNTIARAPLSESTLERFGSLFDDKGVITYRKFMEQRPSEFATRKKQGRVPDNLDEIFLSKDFGRQMEDYWTDINPLRIRADKDNPAEKLEYPTQKPLALLSRIIETITSENDIVADFFAGSGTTGAVAEKLGRKWIMCDTNEQAVKISRKRLEQLVKESEKTNG